MELQICEAAAARSETKSMKQRTTAYQCGVVGPSISQLKHSTLAHTRKSDYGKSVPKQAGHSTLCDYPEAEE